MEGKEIQFVEKLTFLEAKTAILHLDSQNKECHLDIKQVQYKN